MEILGFVVTADVLKPQNLTTLGGVLPNIYVENQQYNKPALHFLDALEHQVNLGYWLGGGGFI